MAKTTKSKTKSLEEARAKGDLKFFKSHDHQASADLAYGEQKSACATSAKRGAKAYEDASLSSDWSPSTD